VRIVLEQTEQLRRDHDCLVAWKLCLRLRYKECLEDQISWCDWRCEPAWQSRPHISRNLLEIQFVHGGEPLDGAILFEGCL
jgi:hypothetical protein